MGNLEYLFLSILPSQYLVAIYWQHNGFRWTKSLPTINFNVDAIDKQRQYNSMISGNLVH